MKLPELVENWRSAWRWFSVQLLTVLAIMPTLYDNAEIFQQFFTPTAFHALMSILAVLAALGRLVKQPAP